MSTHLELPSLPLGTAVHTNKRRFKKGARLIDTPLQGWIGWVEPINIPGYNLTKGARLKYYWNAQEQMWRPVVPRLAFTVSPDNGYDCDPNVGAD